MAKDRVREEVAGQLADLKALEQDARLSRRAFLRGSLLGSAALGVGALLPAGCDSYPVPAAQSAVLSDKQHAILSAISRAIIGAPEDFPDPVESGTVARLDGILSQLPEEIRDQFKLLLNFFEHATPIFGAGLGRFTSLSPERQEKYVRSWMESLLRFRQMAFAALKMFVQLSYYAGDKTWRALRYDGPWVGRFEIDPIAPPLARNPEGPVADKGELVEATDHKGDLDLDCEICVVGSGAGGAVVAKELAEAGFDVIVLEEGGNHRSNTFTQREEEMAPRLYREAGGRTTWDLSIPILQGRTLGGSTVHNICLSYRIEPAIIERWRREYGVSFTHKDLEPLAARVEQHLGVNQVQPWQVNLNNQAFAKGCEKCGVSWERPNHNRVNCLMCGFCDQGCAYDRKQSMLITYLPRAVQAGARVYTDCRVDSVTRSGGAATGVEGMVLDRGSSEPKGRLRVRAKKVILSASAIDTVLLLRRSGVEDESGLLGHRLHVHPFATVAAMYDRPIEAWRGIPQSAYSDHYARFKEDGYGGYVLIPGFAHPGMGASVMPGMGAQHGELMKQYAYTAAGGLMLHDETQGVIGEFPVGRRARIHYWPEESEHAELKDAVSNLAKIYLASGATKVLLPWNDAPMARTDAEVDKLVAEREIAPHKFLLTSVHPQASCPMGEDSKKSVIDSRGKVHGMSGLYVADGSVFPTSIGTPPTIAIATLATWIANGIAAEKGA
ncbi:MAG: GMC family oxidoreductase [Chrysiogenetes bacterium]|nr:GMC family oxidoreductase [Chrysiogenetes bacterium]